MNVLCTNSRTRAGLKDMRIILAYNLCACLVKLNEKWRNQLVRKRISIEVALGMGVNFRTHKYNSNVI